MTGFATMPSPTDLMQAWRRQLGHRARLADQHGPRPFAVVSYRLRRPSVGMHIDLVDLTLVALFDERLESGVLATRLVGVAGNLDADGLRFGGPALTRFDKNLRLGPTASGRGARVNAANSEFLSFALQLERYLERCSRHPSFPRSRTPRLPILLADNFKPGEAGLVDMISVPKRQVLPIDSPARDLCGHCGAASFDFYHTRFRVAQ